MEFEYKGGNCVVMTTKKTVIAIDPDLSTVGLKNLSGKHTFEVFTQGEPSTNGQETIAINMPGEYEIRGASIKGIAAQRHIDGPDAGNKAVMYSIDMGDVRVGVVGHVASPLTDIQLEELGVLDIVIIPVGGNGYTLDAHEAVKVVRQIDPKIVIPTHYADKALKYEVEQNGLEGFAKELGVTHEVVDKLKLKNGVVPESLTLYEITRTS